jgi:hypothetical protein
MYYHINIQAVITGAGVDLRYGVHRTECLYADGNETKSGVQVLCDNRITFTKGLMTIHNLLKNYKAGTGGSLKVRLKNSKTAWLLVIYQVGRDSHNNGEGRV